MSETAESNAGMRRCACIPDGGGPRCAEPAAHSGWHRVGPLSWSPTPEPRTVPEWMVDDLRAVLGRLTGLDMKGSPTDAEYRLHAALMPRKVDDE